MYVWYKDTNVILLLTILMQSAYPWFEFSRWIMRSINSSHFTSPILYYLSSNYSIKTENLFHVKETHGFCFFFFCLMIKGLFTPKLTDNHLPLLNPDGTGTAIKPFSSWTSTKQKSALWSWAGESHIISSISLLEGRDFPFHSAPTSSLKRICLLCLRPGNRWEERTVASLLIIPHVGLSS